MTNPGLDARTPAGKRPLRQASDAKSTALLDPPRRTPISQPASAGLLPAFTDATLYTKTATPDEPFDIAYVGWLPDYHDPSAFLNVLLQSGALIPTLNAPAYRARLATAAQLTGIKLYLTYARLDADLARNAAPLVAYGNASSHDLFSARIGCQTYAVDGIDLAALCIKHRR